MIEKIHSFFMRMIVRWGRTSIYFLGFMAIAYGCSFSPAYDIERGGVSRYIPGLPEIYVDAHGFLNGQGESFIQLDLGITYGSLIYTSHNDTFRTKVDIDVLILLVSDEQQPKSYRYTYDIHSPKQSITYNQDKFLFSKKYNVSPGEYIIEVSVSDKISDKSSKVTVKTYIPDPLLPQINLTSIRMLYKQNDDSTYRIAKGYELPQFVDTVQFVVQVTNNNDKNPLRVESDLVQFHSDTSWARSMSHPDYSASSIERRGINYSKKKTLLKVSRTLRTSGTVTLEFSYPGFSLGNYRFSIKVFKNKERVQYKVRDFGVRNPNFPSMKTPKELLRPLVYLMNRKQFRQLSKIEQSDSLKKEIDRFWLKNLGSPSKASKNIYRFYERVEEANKVFSGVKEGWKTDMGLIFIYYGYPIRVQKSLNTMHWYYSNDPNADVYRFSFMRHKIPSDGYPFHHYVLDRSSSYFLIQNNQIRRWLNGNI